MIHMKFKIIIFLVCFFGNVLVNCENILFSENNYAINDINENKEKKLNNTSVKNNNDSLKVALCAIGKDENLYVREWVKYYKDLGLKKIILYDNNELEGEKFDEVINDYIESEFVEVIDRRGIVRSINTDEHGMTLQGLVYRDCYYNNYEKYDWLFFFDLDEFLCIDYKYKDIFEFLNDFTEYDGIKVQWRNYGDNGYLHYENKPVIERFKHKNNFKIDKSIKTILKGRKYDFNVLFNSHGILSDIPIIVNLNKIRIKISENSRLHDLTSSKPYDNLPVYLDHFKTKSTEEFIKRKYMKPGPDHGAIKDYWSFSIDKMKGKYFDINEITKKKIRMFNKARRKYRKLEIKRNKNKEIYKNEL